MQISWILCYIYIFPIYFDLVNLITYYEKKYQCMWTTLTECTSALKRAIFKLIVQISFFIRIKVTMHSPPSCIHQIMGGTTSLREHNCTRCHDLLPAGFAEIYSAEVGRDFSRSCLLPCTLEGHVLWFFPPVEICKFT